MDNLAKLIFFYLVIHLTIFFYQEYSRPMSIEEKNEIYINKMKKRADMRNGPKVPPPTEEQCKEKYGSYEEIPYSDSWYKKHCPSYLGDNHDVQSNE